MSYRRIMVRGLGEFRYRVGRGHTRFVLPRGGALVASNAQVAGVSATVFERGQWKRTTDGMVTPARVEAFLRAWLGAPDSGLRGDPVGRTGTEVGPRDPASSSSSDAAARVAPPEAQP